jgi:hypothetical protein
VITPRNSRVAQGCAVAALLAAALVLTACGQDESSGGSTTTRERTQSTLSTSTVPPGMNGTSAGGSPTTGAVASSSAAPATTSAALTSILQRAVQEERHAEATYRNIIASLGAIQPFVAIADAEGQHVAALVQLAGDHSVDVSGIQPAGDPAPADKRLACQLGVGAERADIALYDELLPQVASYPDVTRVMQNLRAASQDNHLPAFQRCA